ncbi:cation ABC transporter permease [Aureimonas ureilytica]|uniref:Cation ABC transporter permease n=1 Tax=Aureimonas ureilytica TaxID=401562 RepID=A0A175RDM8_9HYPH|nr:metal ABC transporter permease [Aureimonas ureilytica]KTQ97057.1 cation ABC transporter permease [Aureimonas ureilytica]
MFDAYMINTWLGGTLVAVVAGVVGFFVVIRGSSFAAHALPLSAFPGAAAASLLGIDPLIGLLVFSALGILGISQLTRLGRSDIATALTLAMLLGLGALFLSRTTEYFQAIYALLFGEILGISLAALGTVAALGAVCLVAVAVLFRPLLLSSVSPDLCEARGVSGAWMEIGFLSIVGLATTMALPVVGALLVFSLMVGPASAARAFTDHPVKAMLLSASLSAGTVWIAIALSYQFDLPIGFFVGAISAISYGVGRLRARRAGRSPDPGLVPVRRVEVGHS